VNTKKRIIKDYDALTEETLDQIKLRYPRGFAQHLVKYTDRNGKLVSALPFECEDIYYLVRMTIREAEQIIEDDDDYDDDGMLRDDFGLDDEGNAAILDEANQEEEEEEEAERLKKDD